VILQALVCRIRHVANVHFGSDQIAIEKHFEILADGYIADFYDDFKSLSDAQKKLVAELVHNFAKKNKEA
jgi:hypothetical protein